MFKHILSYKLVLGDVLTLHSNYFRAISELGKSMGFLQNKSPLKFYGENTVLVKIV